MHGELIKQAYMGFNKRDIDAVLVLMQPDVEWPNGWEGGYVKGKEAIREYWTRQWAAIDPTVEPVSLTEIPGGQIETDVHQVVKDLNGSVLFDGHLKHTYSFENGLIKRMDISEL